MTPPRIPTSPSITARRTMAGKQADKAELQKLMGLRQEPYVPIVGIVSRLVSHKGLDLVCEVLHDMMELPLQMVILGKGDRKYEEFFQWAAQQYSAAWPCAWTTTRSCPWPSMQARICS